MPVPQAGYRRGADSLLTRLCGFSEEVVIPDHSRAHSPRASNESGAAHPRRPAAEPEHFSYFWPLRFPTTSRMGKNTDSTTPPTMTPMTEIRIGSIMLVRDFTEALTWLS